MVNLSLTVQMMGMLLTTANNIKALLSASALVHRPAIVGLKIKIGGHFK